MKNKPKIFIYSLCLIGAFIFLSNIHVFGQESNITVTDIDGNVYNTVIIGSQIWMVEDLKTTKYNTGAIIQYVTDESAWSKVISYGAYCWYNNDIYNKEVNGALYNWFAVGTGNLCPKGWHVPSIEDWTTLCDFLGGYKVAGGKMKEAGSSHWLKPNKGADNSSGFTALPGGYRNEFGTFSYMGNSANWWTSSENRIVGALSIRINYDTSKFERYAPNEKVGSSVRCIKDN